MISSVLEVIIIVGICFTCLGFGCCVCTQNFFSHCLFAASTHYSQVTVRCASFQLLNCSKNKENYKKWTLNQHNLLEVWYHTFYLVQNFSQWSACYNMAELLDELQNAEFKEAFDEFDRVRKIW